jgi:hypothetical protein
MSDKEPKKRDLPEGVRETRPGSGAFIREDIDYDSYRLVDAITRVTKKDREPRKANNSDQENDNNDALKPDNNEQGGKE